MQTINCFSCSSKIIIVWYTPPRKYSGRIPVCRKPCNRWDYTVFRGATGRIWTGDLLITNQLLYRLSHSSKKTILSITIIGRQKAFNWNELHLPPQYCFMIIPQIAQKASPNFTQFHSRLQGSLYVLINYRMRKHQSIYFPSLGHNTVHKKRTYILPPIPFFEKKGARFCFFSEWSSHFFLITVSFSFHNHTVFYGKQALSTLSTGLSTGISPLYTAHFSTFSTVFPTIQFLTHSRRCYAIYIITPAIFTLYMFTAHGHHTLILNWLSGWRSHLNPGLRYDRPDTHNMPGTRS